MKKTIIASLIIIALFSLFVLAKNQNKGDKSLNTDSKDPLKTLESNSESIPVIYYSNTCPHCQDLEAWMVENKIEDKIQIIRKEVHDDRLNYIELTDVAKKCELGSDGIGVPLLYTDGACLIGKPDISNFLSQKTTSLEATQSSVVNQQ